MSIDWLAEVVLDPGIPPVIVYVILFLSCVLESFFPPWPTDLIAVYAGFLAGRGVLGAGTVFGVAVLGTQVGVMIVFWISRRWGRVLFEGRLRRYLPIERLQQLELWFMTYGAPAIAVSRFFPGVRALVMPAAGLARFVAWKVWVYAGLAVVLWNVLVVGLGLLAGTHLERATTLLARYNMAAGALLGLLVLGIATVWIYQRFVTRRPRAGAR